MEFAGIMFHGPFQAELMDGAEGLAAAAVWQLAQELHDRQAKRFGQGGGSFLLGLQKREPPTVFFVFVSYGKGGGFPFGLLGTCAVHRQKQHITATNPSIPYTLRQGGLLKPLDQE